MAAHADGRHPFSWLSLTLEASHCAAEVITDYLTALGAEGVSVTDATDIRQLLDEPAALHYFADDFLNSLSDRATIVAYFIEQAEGVLIAEDPQFLESELYDDRPRTWITREDLSQRIERRLQQIAAFLPSELSDLTWQTVAETDWAENWKQYYQTLHLTERLVVNPSWISYTPTDDELMITLDPGSAFGTGSHETTVLCAAALEAELRPGMQVLDLGCGSGILAIFAARLGAGKVEGIDLDPRAVEVARANAAQNQVDITLHAGELKDAQAAPYDLIVANILSGVLIALAPELSRSLKPGGRLILSGITLERGGEVLNAYLRQGMREVTRAERGGWLAYVLTGS